VSASSRARFAEVVRAEQVDLGLACLLIGAELEPDLSVEAGLAALDSLAAQVPTGRGPADALRAVLGGFHGEPSDYGDLRSSLLDEVLRRRRGLPILLSVLWCEVAGRCGLPAACLGKPGHVLALVGDEVVDPFAGGAVLDVDPSPVMTANDVLLRVLDNIRLLTSRQGRSLEATRTRLWATELALLLPRHPLDLRRERGELLVRTGSFGEGAAELEAFAQIAPPESAAAALSSARQARARLN
jgi:hypothetical protein